MVDDYNPYAAPAELEKRSLSNARRRAAREYSLT